ncbi:MAG: hypothetical protein CMB89_10000, partial [Flammeovirgaceae bacterium]|nr:hypothetical protein [Flammeovirgaceae bacterium]
MSFSFLSLNAQDYYWVGGTGNWSDYENHWATSSGGTTFHTSAPSATNNVYFDANSFSAADQIVNIDEEAYCLGMDWTGVTNTPMLDGGTDHLNIAGSLTLIADMILDHRYFDFESDLTTNTITTGNIDNSYLELDFFGTGKWALQDSIKAKEIITSNSVTVDLNDQYVTLFSIYTYSSSVVDLGASEIHLVNFRISSTAIEPIVPGNSVVYINNSFYTGGASFNKIILDVPLVSQVSQQDDATIDSLVLLAGTTVNFEAGSTLTVNQLIAEGTKAENIEVYTSVSGTQVTISQSSGTVNAEYLSMQDIAATGGATFNATNSIDNGNNSGWTITGLTGSKFYWTNGTGRWSDYENHWATTSGGSTMHTEVPGQLDSIFFDANSFSSDDTVTVDIDASCANLDWTGTDQSILFTTTDSKETLSIYGSLVITEDVTPDFDEIHFLSDSTGNNIYTNNQSLGRNSELWFSGNGGWTLQDSLFIGDMTIESGTLDFNDQYVEIINRLSISSTDSKTVDFGTSDLHLESYYYTTSGLTLDASEATIYLDGNNSRFRANPTSDITYNKVIIDGKTVFDFYDHTIDTLEVRPGSWLSIAGGDTLFLNSFKAEGTLADSITIKSADPGVQAVIKIESGTVEGSYLKISDNVATGGATFSAFESKNEGNVSGWDFMEDTTAPEFISGYPELDSLEGTIAYYNLKTNEPAYVYYVVLAEGATQPSAAQIILGTDASDADAIISDSVIVELADELTSMDIEGLEEETNYEIFFAIKDAADNIQSSVNQSSITTPDTSAPEFADGYPVISTTGSTDITLDVSLTEAGTVYYVVLANDATEPSPSQVKSGVDASDSSPAASGNIEVTAIETSISKSIEGLTSETNYDIYLATEDDLSNLSSSVQLLEVLTEAEAKDFYWVGGSGNWSEFATHWATSSGGSTFHTVAPSSIDNVFFDANSFSDAEQSITIDEVAYCNDMDWSAVSNAPTLEGSTNTLNISGSLILTESMTVSHRSIDFDSNDLGNTITTANHTMSNLNIRFYGSGSWILQDSLKAGEVNSYETTTVDFNDQYVSLNSLYPRGSSTIDFGASEVFLVNLRNNSSATEPIIPGSSSITIDNSFYAGESTYNKIILDGDSGDEIVLQDNFEVDSLVIKAGLSINFEAGTTITVGQLISVGTKTDSISLFTSTPGSQVTISQASGTVAGEYLILQDIEATGGATFTASNSQDNGNNTGWTFTGDDTAPSFNTGYPAIDSISSERVYIQVSVDEPSTVYYVFLDSESTTPSASQILAGTDSSDEEALVSGSESIDSFDTEEIIEITGLSPNTDYDLYLALVDASDNIQSSVSTLSISTEETKEEQTITFTDDLTGLTYGDSDITLNATASSGLDITYEFTGPVTIEGTTLQITGAGEATVTASQTGDDTYETAEPVEISFTISKAELTVTADDQSITYGDELPEYTVSYSGFIGTDDVSVLDTTPTVSSDASTASNAGEYSLSVDGASDDNYSFSYTEGTLTIAKANQTITFTQTDVDISDSPIILSATSSVGLDVTFTLISGSATLEGST